jgi:transposase
MLVGWDWAAESHDVTVIDDEGGVVDCWALRHDEAGIGAALARLSTLGSPGELPVAIEATGGVVVDRLLAAGHPVVAVHPNAFWAARPRWGTSRAKSDRGDFFKLADYLRTDGHRLRRLRSPGSVTAELVALSRMRDDHVAARVAATNQLAALLGRHWPGAVVVFARLDSAIALAFLEDYPTPAAAERLGETRMALFCRRHSYSGRRSPAELVARLVATQVGVLHTLMDSIAQLERALGSGLTDHPKAALLASLPRVGVVNLAQLLAEVGPILDRGPVRDSV